MVQKIGLVTAVEAGNQVVISKLNEIIEKLGTNTNSRDDRIKVKKTRKSVTRRDTILFAAVLYNVEGLRYCGFLDTRKVKPKWLYCGPSTYRESYLNPSYTKKVQDEKSRAKRRMMKYTDSTLMDAFITHLPKEFAALGGLLNSRNSRHASKNSQPIASA